MCVGYKDEGKPSTIIDIPDALDILNVLRILRNRLKCQGIAEENRSILLFLDIEPLIKKQSKLPLVRYGSRR